MNRTAAKSFNPHQSPCRGYGCTSTELVRAHIVPRGFGRSFLGEGPNMSLSMETTRIAQPQLGEFDLNILCAQCDNRLGNLDDYAIAVCRRFAVSHRLATPPSFEMPDVNCVTFSKFILAVLWRASISQRPAFSDVDLGAHENTVNEIILGGRPLTDLPAFRLIVQRLYSAHMDPAGIYTRPDSGKFRDSNCFTFLLGGFKIIAILDSRPLPLFLLPYFINKNDLFRGFMARLEDTAEFAALADMVVADAVRKGVTPRELRRR